MTEKETREKAIEEMARIMCNAKETCNECVGRNSNIYFRDISDCKCYYGATRAFNAGYRKEEEVRKETAKAVIEYFETHMICAACEGVIQDAYERFGVEVEE